MISVSMTWDPFKRKMETIPLWIHQQNIIIRSICAHTLRVHARALILVPSLHTRMRQQQPAQSWQTQPWPLKCFRVQLGIAMWRSSLVMGQPVKQEPQVKTMSWPFKLIAMLLEKVMLLWMCSLSPLLMGANLLSKLAMLRLAQSSQLQHLLHILPKDHTYWAQFW
jgi:hypothetical protein